MKIEKKETCNYLLDVTLSADREEFRSARQKAYMDYTDLYVVPGIAPGLATLEELTNIYGPAVLYDEGLDYLIPKFFGEFLEVEKIRIMGKPEVKEVFYKEDGGVSFRIEADMYPEIALGQYLGIQVPYKRTDVEYFEKAVFQIACQSMAGQVPKHMVDHKLNALAAKEKLNVSKDAIYHLLADTIVILQDSYRAAGVNRPFVQIREEALDIMLQTVSGDNKKVTQEFFVGLVRSMVGRYHALEMDFVEKVGGFIEKRAKNRASMSPENQTEEAFTAYLGSLGLDEKQWRKERETLAAKEVCQDLLLDAVAKEEKLEVSHKELMDYIEHIAIQCNMEVEEVMGQIDTEPIRWQILREKARTLILNSALESC